MIEPTRSFEELVAIMAVFNGFDGPDPDNVWWRTDDKYAPITMFLNCNDLFYWGCGDCEQISASDIPELQKAVEDGGAIYGPYLWVARKRRQRPQKAYYKHFGGIEHLFDACGPIEDQYGTAEYLEKRKAPSPNPHTMEA